MAATMIGDAPNSGTLLVGPGTPIGGTVAVEGMLITWAAHVRQSPELLPTLALSDVAPRVSGTE